MGETATLAVHRQGDTVRRMQVLVRAEGPTRVLSITDLQVHHPFLNSGSPKVYSKIGLRWYRLWIQVCLHFNTQGEALIE